MFHDRREIEAALETCDVLGWAAYEFYDQTTGRRLTTAEQAEWCHPGITMCLWRLLMARNETLPPNYLTGTSGGIYCSYWLMARAHFDEYMHWSYPLVRRCLDEPDAVIRSHPRSIGFVLERLFLCWCELTAKRVRNLARPVPGVCVNRFLSPRGEAPGATQRNFLAGAASASGAAADELGRRLHRAREQIVRRRAYVCQTGREQPRIIELLPGGTVWAEKAADLEEWSVRASEQEILLELSGSRGCRARLHYYNDYFWHGTTLLGTKAAMALLPAALLFARRGPGGSPCDTRFPIELVDRLRRALDLRCFVAMGSADDVPRAVLPRFEQVHTLEPGQRWSDVLPALDGPALLWLDKATRSELPLLAELAAIYAHRPDHVLLLNNAGRFLEPNAAPHDPRKCPNFADLSDFLARQRPAPFVDIVGDVLLIAPAAVGALLARPGNDS